MNMTEVAYQKRESMDDIIERERDKRSPMQQLGDQHRANIVRALDQAQTHLNSIGHNPVAVERQNKVIAQYKAQLAAVDGTEWLK
jgi:hypothetical protein